MRLTVLAVAAIAALPGVLPAQQWKDQINQQILDSQNVREWLGSGYTRSHGPFYDLLAESASHTITLELNASKNYAFIGKCDNDCTDVDFRLLDDQGNEVDSDLATDDYPVVRVSPPRNGTYRLRVIMADCSTPTCGWGVVGFAQTRPATVASSSSSSSTEWKDQINRQLLDSPLIASFLGQGYSRSHPLQYDLLAESSSQTVSFPLSAGKTYAFVGKCDNDCSDLDFRLLDERGQEVDSDLATDDFPVVRVTPGRSATYSLRITMADCSTALCGWGVMVLGK